MAGLTALAHAAAALLPEPPAEGDIIGYLGWRELVWGTALRLGELADLSATVADFVGDQGISDSCDCAVTAEDLLALAGLAVPDVRAARRA